VTSIAMKTTRPVQEELMELAADLEGSSAKEILKWAADRYTDRLTFATGFGVEGCVLIDIIGRCQIPIDIFTLDTGLLFEETYKLWSQLESRYTVKIRRVSPALNVEQQAQEFGGQLWEREPDRCCEIRKVMPLEAALANVDAWITAIRREQTPERANAKIIEWDDRFGLIKVNPLVAWTTKDIWRHIIEHEVPYNPLHDHGYPSIGCYPCTSQVKPGEDDRAGRWRGTRKNECGLHGPAVPTRFHQEK